MTFDAGAIEARLILNRQEFQAELAAATAEGDAFDGKTFEAKATLNTDEVKAALAAIEAEWSTLKAQLAEGTELNLDDDEALGKIAEVEAAFQALRGSLEQDVKIKTDSNAASKIAEQLASSGPVEQSLTIDPAKAFAALQEIQDKYLELKVLLESLRLDLDTTDFDDAIIRAITEVSILKRAVTDMKLTVDNTEALRAIAETATAYHTMRATLTSNMSLGGGSAVVAGAAAGAGAGGGGGGGGGAAGAAAAGAAAGGAARGVIAFTNGLAGLNTQFRLFGGVLPGFLGAIGSIHLIIEGAVEILGTLIPATIAFTTFGVAAIQTVTDLSSRMQALYQVSDAYGKSIYPLTGQQQALAASVRPEVYVLFGEALDIINSKAGAFNQLATQSGQVLDQLFARLDNAIAGTKGLSSGLQGVARATGVAITQGSGFSIFLHNAAADLSGWGNLIGNIGGIIGNVIKVLPGYAGVLLTALQALSHAIEVFTGSKLGGWIVGIGIAFHGAIIWVGLLATAFAYLARTSLVALDSVLARVAIGLLNMGGVAAKAGAGVAALSDAADAAAGLPWGWISLVAAAVGVLAYKMLTAKDAAQEFNASLQQTIQNSPILQISQTIQQAMDATSQKIVSSQKAVTVAIATAWQQTGPLAARGLDVYKQGVDAAETSNAQYKSGLQSLKQENDLVNSRVQALGKAYGSTGAALVALNEAGITSAQLTNQSGSAWAQVLIILNGYQNTIRAITQTTGRYGAAENALNFSLFDTANKLGFAQDTLQKITQAEDGLLNVIIGGEQSFIAFQQAIQQTGTAAKATGASLGGLSANSLTLASDFYTTALPAAQKLADSLQLMEISSTNFTKVIATSAGQMLQYAGTNLAARDSVAAFINNAV
ncbi:MAG TPA: hypothetical protein VGS41_16370, partial [Chthonomonadales bacterium]|nr:hypothetical protein [Chthonomonadales bacterium]